MMTICSVLKPGLLVLSYVHFTVFVIRSNRKSSVVLEKKKELEGFSLL